jgi:sugar lactone lactonase YvrE
MTLHRTAEVAAEGFTLLEAPRWHDGLLWMSDFFTNRVLRFDVSGGGELCAETVCVVDGQPSGLGFMPDGELRISSMLDRRLLSWDGNRLDVVADYSHLVSGPGNDLAIDSQGVAFVGNFGLDVDDPRKALPTSLLRIMPDGTVSVAAEDVLFPNGIVIDERAGLLFTAETYRSCITVWDYSDGELTNRRVWKQFSPDPGSYDIPTVTELISVVPDGLAQDAEGMLWVADAKGHGIGRVDAQGTVVEFVETGLSVYSAVLGGEDGRDLFLCCAPATETVDPSTGTMSALMRCRVDVPGPAT